MSRIYLSRLALGALLTVSATGCGLFDRCGRCDDRPGLFGGRFRGQGPVEYAMPVGTMPVGAAGDCCGDGMLTNGPFLGAPATVMPATVMPATPGTVLPRPVPAIPPADAGIQETPARPMPYDPNKMSRPGSKPANDLKTAKEV
jgi:hypothetical protein